MQAFLQQTPPWVIVYTLGVLSAFGALVLAMVFDAFAARPRRTYDLDGVTVELWTREGRFPVGADAVLVPVSPDLKMEAGVAKFVRDATGGVAQAEANRVAPLAPGDAFLAAGGRYRFGHAVLAVVMDDQKRVKPEWIRSAVRRSIERARSRGAYSILVPDMTADLVRQPQTLLDTERAETSRMAARAVVDAVASSPTRVGLVRIWLPHAALEPIWMAELERHVETAITPEPVPSVA